jgi:hypothetical protein
MRQDIKSRFTFLVVASIALPACLGEVRPEEEALASVQQEELSENGLTANGLTANGLTANGLMAATLSDDAMSRMFLQYTVSCALPAGRTILLELPSGEYSFQGQLNLAPEWGTETGSCNASCRAWVSACVLARVNYLGVSVPISMRGTHPALGTATEAEMTAYPLPEAAYYGDIFSAAQKRFACKAPGSTLISRVCGGDGVSTTGCIMNVVGDCDQACAAPTADGAFPNCHSAIHDTSDVYPNGTEAFPATVTIYRKP